MIKLTDLYEQSINFIEDNETLIKLISGYPIKDHFKETPGEINESDKNNLLRKAYEQYKANVKGQPLLIDDWTHDEAGAIHIRSNEINGTPFDNKKVKHRIYINSNIKDKWKIADLFRDKVEERKIPYYFKLFNEDQQDNMVIYAYTEYLAQYLDIIQELQKENPEMMNRCGEPPILTKSNISKFIGIADEPGKQFEGKYSYNSLMTELVRPHMIEIAKKNVSKNFQFNKRTVDENGKESSLGKVLTQKIYDSIYQDVMSGGMANAEHWTGITKAEWQNQEVQNRIKSRIYNAIKNSTIEQLLYDKSTTVPTKKDARRGISIPNLWENNGTRQLLIDNCTNLDEIKLETKAYLESIGIDSKKPCFMKETYELFKNEDEKVYDTTEIGKEQKNQFDNTRHGKIQNTDKHGNTVLHEYINPELLKRKMTLPNGRQISARQYLQEVVAPHIPESGTFKLKNGAEISAKQFIEEFVFFEGQENYNGNIEALLKDVIDSDEGQKKEKVKTDEPTINEFGEIVRPEKAEQSENMTNSQSFKDSLKSSRDKMRIGKKDVDKVKEGISLRNERKKLNARDAVGMLNEDEKKRLDELNRMLNIKNVNVQQYEQNKQRKSQNNGLSR